MACHFFQEPPLAAETLAQEIQGGKIAQGQ
jgi:hypothetical protein